MYAYEDYRCPYCNWEFDYSDPALKREGWDYLCPECNEYFETPDV
jgi:peptide subunit release factor 1 (eRF1)